MNTEKQNTQPELIGITVDPRPNRNPLRNVAPAPDTTFTPRINHVVPRPANLWQRLFGIPVWLEDFDGEVTKSRMVVAGSLLIVERHGRKRVALPDGTIKHCDDVFTASYVKRWYLR